ncbi:hypothetical protein D3C73_1539990 [compost metagenome]
MLTLLTLKIKTDTYSIDYLHNTLARFPLEETVLKRNFLRGINELQKWNFNNDILNKPIRRDLSGKTR